MGGGGGARGGGSKVWFRVAFGSSALSEYIQGGGVLVLEHGLQVIKGVRCSPMGRDCCELDSELAVRVGAGVRACI